MRRACSFFRPFWVLSTAPHRTSAVGTHACVETAFKGVGGAQVLRRCGVQRWVQAERRGRVPKGTLDGRGARYGRRRASAVRRWATAVGWSRAGREDGRSPGGLRCCEAQRNGDEWLEVQRGEVRMGSCGAGGALGGGHVLYSGHVVRREGELPGPTVRRRNIGHGGWRRSGPAQGDGGQGAGGGAEWKWLEVRCRPCEKHELRPQCAAGRVCLRSWPPWPASAASPRCS
mmetsp:Transcript_12844/g.22153  ORF Transcript_12844/g.22153 Transcript_12844/m.22153 type:complete len:230 (+) Transcript_12844:380-1069(+)